MPITISELSKQTISRLIRSEFDKIDTNNEFIYNKSEKLITTAKEFGLHDLAEEMTNDLN